MSGDLRDPKSAIPKGTMLAIVVGMVVYLVLGWFLATRVDPEAFKLYAEQSQLAAERRMALYRHLAELRLPRGDENGE